MKIRWDELKEQQNNNRQVNEITESNFIQAFGVTESQMDKAAENASEKQIHQKLGEFASLTSHG